MPENNEIKEKLNIAMDGAKFSNLKTSAGTLFCKTDTKYNKNIGSAKPNTILNGHVVVLFDYGSQVLIALR
jgi:hypothetical protein